MKNTEEVEEDKQPSDYGGCFDESEMEVSIFKEKGLDKEPIKMLQIVFPCSVQQFYQFFYADSAEVYPRSKHLEMKKAHSITVTPWKRNEELKAETREVSAVLKLVGVPLLSEAKMNQVWLLSKNQKYFFDKQGRR